MSKIDYDTPEKDAWRHTTYIDMSPRTSILDMPGHQALSIRHLMATGKITKDTKQQWVEREKDTQRILTGVQKDLALTDCDIWQGDLEDYVPTRKFDNINADMMTGTTLPLMRWFAGISSAILPQCWVVMNTTQWSRRNQFGIWFHNYWPTDPDLSALMKQVQHKHLDTDHIPLMEANFLLRCAFNKFHVTQGPAIPYKGSGNRFDMVSNALIVNEPNDKPFYPSIEELNAIFDPASVSCTHDEIRMKFRVFFAERYGSVGLHLVRDGDDQWSVVTNPLDRTVPAVVENAKLRELALRFGFPWE